MARVNSSSSFRNKRFCLKRMLNIPVTFPDMIIGMQSIAAIPEAARRLIIEGALALATADPSQSNHGPFGSVATWAPGGSVLISP